MNQLLEKELLKEFPCGENFTYVFKENGSFLSTDYKVLQSQKTKSFVPCMKTLFNGKVQILYFTGGKQSLEELLPSLSPERYMTLVSNLLAAIIEVKNNGFLSVENINIQASHIYVDVNTLRISLVYIPIETSPYENRFIFENELRTILVKQINDRENLQSRQTLALVDQLSSGSTSLEEIYRFVKSGKNLAESRMGRSVRKNPDQENPSGVRTLRLIGLNSPNRVEIRIDKPDFTIGKGTQGTDAILGFNKAISRKHCKITENFGEFYLTDLQSANGTYLNRERLVANNPYKISDGDVIRLANSDFKVEVR